MARKPAIAVAAFLILGIFGVFQNCAEPNSISSTDSGSHSGIVVNADSRNWFDGTFAKSCNEYKNSSGVNSYSGAIGDGVYTIDPSGNHSPVKVYCDMTTQGGGWTYLISTVSSGLPQLVLDPTFGYATNSSACTSSGLNFSAVGDYYLYNNYTCGTTGLYVQYNFTWTNTLGATEVLIAGVSGGDVPSFLVNGSNLSSGSNAKNLFAVNYSCGTNLCWKTAAVGSPPVTMAFSGNLTISQTAYSDSNQWGGVVALWTVGVR